MNLFETLKQFKNIESDTAYKEKAKRAILATTPREPWSAWRTVTAVFESGIAVALGVFFILVATGQFPGTSSIAPISPTQFSVINPETLHAEAQAVDIQIQLAKVSYPEATTTAESTPQTTTGKLPAVTPLVAPSALGSTASSTAAGTDVNSTSSASSTTISVEQALKELSQ